MGWRDEPPSFLDEIAERLGFGDGPRNRGFRQESAADALKRVTTPPPDWTPGPSSLDDDPGLSPTDFSGMAERFRDVPEPDPDVVARKHFAEKYPPPPPEPSTKRKAAGWFTDNPRDTTFAQDVERWMGSQDVPGEVVEPVEAHHDSSKRTLSEPNWSEKYANYPLSPSGAPAVVESVVRHATGFDLDETLGTNIRPKGVETAAGRAGKTLTELPAELASRHLPAEDDVAKWWDEDVNLGSVGNLWTGDSHAEEDYLSEGGRKIGTDTFGLVAAPWHLLRGLDDFWTGERPTSEKTQRFLDTLKDVPAHMIRSGVETVADPPHLWQEAPIELAANLAGGRALLGAGARAVANRLPAGRARDVLGRLSGDVDMPARSLALAQEERTALGEAARTKAALTEPEQAAFASALSTPHVPLPAGPVADAVAAVRRFSAARASGVTENAVQDTANRIRAYATAAHMLVAPDLLAPFDIAREAIRRAVRGHGKGEKRTMWQTPSERLLPDEMAVLREAAGTHRRAEWELNTALQSIPYRQRPRVRDAMHGQAEPFFFSDPALNYVEFDAAVNQWRPTAAGSALTDPAALDAMVAFLDTVNPHADLAGTIGSLTARGAAVNMFRSPQDLYATYLTELYPAMRSRKRTMEALGTEIDDWAVDDVGGAVGTGTKRTVAGRLTTAQGSALREATGRRRARGWLDDARAEFERTNGRPPTPDEARTLDASNPDRFERRELRGMSTDLAREVYEGVGEFAHDVVLYETFDGLARLPGAALTDAEFAAMPRGLRREGRYVKVSDERLIPGVDGSPPAYGALSGRWVREDLIFELANQRKAASEAAGFLGKMNRMWKTTHTAWSPSTVSRNMLTNLFMLAPMAGISPLNPLNLKYYTLALKDLLVPAHRKSPQFRQAWNDGALNGLLGRTELSTWNELEPFRGATGTAMDLVRRHFAVVEGLTTGAERVTYGVPRAGGRLAQRGSTASELGRQAAAGADQLLTIAKDVLDSPGRLYSAGDEWFRLAHYYKQTDPSTWGALARTDVHAWGGVPFRGGVAPIAGPVAGRASQDAFVNYADVNGWVQILRAPFWPAKRGRRGELLDHPVEGGEAALRTLGWGVVARPFVAYPSKAIPLVASWAERHPLRANVMLALHDRMTHRNMVDAGVEDPEAFESLVESMPFWNQLRYVPGVYLHPKMHKRGTAPTGEGDEDQVLMANVSYFQPQDVLMPQPQPFSSGFDDTLDYLKAQAGQGPVLGPLANVIRHVDDFTGEEIVTRGLPVSTQLKQAANYLWTNQLGPMAPGLDEFGIETGGVRLPAGSQREKLRSAASGIPDRRGRMREQFLVDLDVLGGTKFDTTTPSGGLASLARDFLERNGSVEKALLGNVPRRAMRVDEEGRGKWKLASAEAMLGHARAFRRSMRGLKTSPAWAEMDEALEAVERAAASTASDEAPLDEALFDALYTARQIVGRMNEARGEAVEEAWEDVDPWTEEE